MRWEEWVLYHCWQVRQEWWKLVAVLFRHEPMKGKREIRRQKEKRQEEKGRDTQIVFMYDVMFIGWNDITRRMRCNFVSYPLKSRQLMSSWRLNSRDDVSVIQARRREKSGERREDGEPSSRFSILPRTIKERTDTVKNSPTRRKKRYLKS